MDFDRFLDAQQGMYDGVKAELGAGRKRGHWMWFVFPQAAGLGRSPTAQYYGITSLAGAAAYAAHPVLGARLRECAGLLLAAPGESAADIMGQVDAMKLRSSVTLFQAAAPGEAVYGQVLDRFYDGIPDAATLRILAGWGVQAAGPEGTAGGQGPDSVGP